jgi:tRNA G26 N,N-dimethylase Trm1
VSRAWGIPLTDSDVLILSSMLMYSHSPERNRVDVVDLDPYGTAAPFIDAAVQCITDGGMLFSPSTSYIRFLGLTGATQVSCV